MTFEAKYPGRCGICDDRITPGDTCTYDADDQIAHAHCDTEPRREDDPDEACEKCWLIHNGECF